MYTTDQIIEIFFEISAFLFFKCFLKLRGFLLAYFWKIKAVFIEIFLMGHPKNHISSLGSKSQKVTKKTFWPSTFASSVQISDNFDIKLGRRYLNHFGLGPFVSLTCVEVYANKKVDIFIPQAEGSVNKMVNLTCILKALYG